jgi:hypothetical protein
VFFFSATLLKQGETKKLTRQIIIPVKLKTDGLKSSFFDAQPGSRLTP